MRSSYLVSYDIADKMGEQLKLLGESGELFERRLRPSDLVRYRKALRAPVHHGDNGVLFIDLVPSDGQQIWDSLVLTAFNNRATCHALSQIRSRSASQSAPFPGQFPGASSKSVQRVDTFQNGVSFFPSEFTGASLKTFDDFVHRASELVFPQ